MPLCRDTFSGALCLPTITLLWGIPYPQAGGLEVLSRSPLCASPWFWAPGKKLGARMLAYVRISVDLREAALKQVHLRWQQGTEWMLKIGSVATDS